MATAPRVPPAWSPSSCLAPARVASPLVRTGGRGKRAALRPVGAVSGPRAARLRTWLALPRRSRQQGSGKEKRVMKSTRRREPKRRARTPRRGERVCRPATNRRTRPKETETPRDQRQREKGPQPGVYPSYLTRGPAPFPAPPPFGPHPEASRRGTLAASSAEREKGRETHAYCSLSLHPPAIRRVLGPFPTRKGPQRGPWRMAFGVS